MTADAPVVPAGIRPSMPRLLTGWLMVIVVTAMAGLWGFWGAAETRQGAPFVEPAVEGDLLVDRHAGAG